LVDIRKIDGEPLLASRRLEDNVIAVLMRLSDQRAAVRRILRRIAKSRSNKRAGALTTLEVLAGLRKLGRTIVEEAEGMPILDDIMDHDVLGPKYREGVAHGKAEGKAEMVRQMIEKRFGALPKWAQRRLEAMTVTDIQRVSLRLFDATTLKDLLG
jgi:hypothetical protein